MSAGACVVALGSALVEVLLVVLSSLRRRDARRRETAPAMGMPSIGQIMPARMPSIGPREDLINVFEYYRILMNVELMA